MELNDKPSNFDRGDILNRIKGQLTGNTYAQTNLVANKPEYDLLILDPTFVNAWGVAIRPAGLGGHFWVTTAGSGISYEYVGDVNGTPLFQDDLKEVTVPGPNGTQGSPTGVVFNGSKILSLLTRILPDAHPSGRVRGGGCKTSIGITPSSGLEP
jgi:hypothetical protein